MNFLIVGVTNQGSSYYQLITHFKYDDTQANENYTHFCNFHLSYTIGSTKRPYSEVTIDSNGKGAILYTGQSSIKKFAIMRFDIIDQEVKQQIYFETTNDNTITVSYQSGTRIVVLIFNPSRSSDNEAILAVFTQQSDLSYIYQYQIRMPSGVYYIWYKYIRISTFFFDQNFSLKVTLFHLVLSFYVSSSTCDIQYQKLPSQEYVGIYTSLETKLTYVCHLDNQIININKVSAQGSPTPQIWKYQITNNLIQYGYCSQIVVQDSLSSPLTKFSALVYHKADEYFVHITGQINERNATVKRYKSELNSSHLKFLFQKIGKNSFDFVLTWGYYKDKMDCVLSDTTATKRRLFIYDTIPNNDCISFDVSQTQITADQVEKLLSYTPLLVNVTYETNAFGVIGAYNQSFNNSDLNFYSQAQISVFNRETDKLCRALYIPEITQLTFEVDLVNPQIALYPKLYFDIPASNSWSGYTCTTSIQYSVIPPDSLTLNHINNFL
eukprot:403336725